MCVEGDTPFCIIFLLKKSIKNWRMKFGILNLGNNMSLPYDWCIFTIHSSYIQCENFVYIPIVSSHFSCPSTSSSPIQHSKAPPHSMKSALLFSIIPLLVCTLTDFYFAVLIPDEPCDIWPSGSDLLHLALWSWDASIFLCRTQAYLSLWDNSTALHVHISFYLSSPLLSLHLHFWDNKKINI